MRRCQRGFTLIELAVVIVILGLVAALVFPRLNAGALGRGKLRNSVARIAATATYARNRAACTRRMHVLHLDPNSGEYWVSDQASETDRSAAPGGGRELRGRLPAGVRFKDIQTAGRSRLLEEIVRLRFGLEGWADPAVVRVAGDDRDVATLTITGLCGRVETAMNDE